MLDSPSNLARYARQARLPQIGDAGQARLAAAHVAIVGCGALGCASADLLCRAGAGRVTVIDRDVVEMTNLQRQTLFAETDAIDGLPKAEAARRRLVAINSMIDVRAVIADLHHRNAVELLGVGDASTEPTVIVDGTDNFITRYLLNDIAIKFGVPFVYAGVVGTRAMQMNVLPGRGPCLRCVFPEPPEPGSQPTCESAGVLGAAVMMIASMQGAEAIKIAIGETDAVSTTLREVDVWSSRWREIDLTRSRREDCPACGLRHFEFLDSDAPPTTVSLCGQNAVQITAGVGASRVDLGEIATRLTSVGRVHATPFMVRVVPSGEGMRLSLFADGRAIVHGTADPGIAKAMYDRVVGR